MKIILMISIVMFSSCTKSSPQFQSAASKLAHESSSRGSLSESEFEEISAMVDNFALNMSAVAQAPSYGLRGDDTDELWFEKLKEDCQKLNWNAATCRSKLTEYRNIVKVQDELSFKQTLQQEQKEKAEEVAKEEKAKAAGY